MTPERLQFLSPEWLDCLTETVRALEPSGHLYEWASLEFTISDRRAGEPATPRWFSALVDRKSGLFRIDADNSSDPQVRVRAPLAVIFSLLVEGRIDIGTKAVEDGDLTFVGSISALMVFAETASLPTRSALTELLIGSTAGLASPGAIATTALGPLEVPASPPSHDVCFTGNARLIAALDKTRTTLRRLIRDGETPGYQLAISVGPEAVGAVSWAGHARFGIEMREDTILPWLCCTKLLGVVAFAQLWTRGLITPEARIADVIPEFSRNGKHRITYGELLTHTTGISEEPVSALAAVDADGLLPQIFDMPPGQSRQAEANYSTVWSWMVLARTVEILTGQAFDAYVSRELTAPARLRSTLFADGRGRPFVEQFPERIAFLYSIDGQVKTALPLFTQREHFERCLPHIGLVATCSDILSLFIAFLDRPQILGVSRETVRQMTRCHRVGLYDAFYGGALDWGLGLCTDGRLFGTLCSRQSVGHLGFRSSCIVKDPVADVAIAFNPNGLVGKTKSQGRVRDIVDAVISDVRSYENQNLPHGSPWIEPRALDKFRHAEPTHDQ